MSKAKKTKKKDQETALTETFFVARRNGVVEYVSGYDKPTHTPLWSTDINDAIWSYDSSKVQLYITRNNITNVTVETKNGDHPTGKPPL